MNIVFDSLIKELELEVDEYGGCAILIDELNLYASLNPKDNIIISCPLGVVPEGKYRENLFLQALQKNLHHPQVAVFAYDEEENQFFAVGEIPLKQVNAVQFSSFLDRFSQRVKQWKNDLTQGNGLS